MQPEDTVPSSDPTIAHAGLTELGLDQSSQQPAETDAEPTAIAEASTGDASANQSAEAQWDTPTANDASQEQLDESFEMVPRPAAETEAIHEPAQPQSTNSWADQDGASANAVATEAATENSTATNGLSTDAEGYQSVERRAGRGGARGRGGRGRNGYRGRGGRGRGDGRGRGRGGAPQTQA